jgi:chaperonin GroES
MLHDFMKIKPLSDRVVLEAISVEEKTASGIVLPDTAEKERPEQGKVIAVGPGKVIAELGKRVPVNIKVGDVVLFTKYGPNEVKVDGKEYLIAREEDILAILE